MDCFFRDVMWLAPSDMAASDCHLPVPKWRWSLVAWLWQLVVTWFYHREYWKSEEVLLSRLSYKRLTALFASVTLSCSLSPLPSFSSLPFFASHFQLPSPPLPLYSCFLLWNQPLFHELPDGVSMWKVTELLPDNNKMENEAVSPTPMRNRTLPTVQWMSMPADSWPTMPPVETTAPANT